MSLWVVLICASVGTIANTDVVQPLHHPPLLQERDEPFYWSFDQTVGAPMYGAGGVYKNPLNLTCLFKVPPTPPAWTPNPPKYDELFLWCGVQYYPYRNSFPQPNLGIIQPVLMWGGCCNSHNGVGYPSDPHYAQDPYWYFSAQYVYPNNTYPYPCCTCDSAVVYKTSPGNVIYNEISYDASQQVWNVIQRDLNSSSPESKFVVHHPFDDPSLTWGRYTQPDMTTVEAFAVVEEHYIEEGEQPQKMPHDEDWVITVSGASAPLQWQANAGPVVRIDKINPSKTDIHIDLQWPGQSVGKKKKKVAKRSGK